MTQQTLVNFGRNLNFTAEVFTPRSESELLDMMVQVRGRTIRVVGRLHSWSEAPVSEDVVFDLRHLNEVAIEDRHGQKWAIVGAGCQIKRLLTELERQGAGTTPSLGLITEQAIAGAMATGTHGSGKHSLSHYAEEIRIAVYDPLTGQPTIRTISSGDELRAARCSLGAMGVIVSVAFPTRSAYNVEEFFAEYDALPAVMEREAEFPLQQFYLVPWRWSYVAQHRRETELPCSRLAFLYRWYFHIVIDVGLHLCLLLWIRVLRSRSLARFFFRHIATRTVIWDWHVTDRAQNMLIMEHELFRHIEIEIFVPRASLDEALSLTKALMRHFDGDPQAFSDSQHQQLAEAGFWSGLKTQRGAYTHQYMVCVRRILVDDTLISMSSGGDQPWYSLSFISYAAPKQRQGFFVFADQLSQIMATLYGGRPHWGKYCPLSRRQAEQLYQELPRFRQICDQFDAQGVFRNSWLKSLINSTDQLGHPTADV